jgi:microcin C transport system substrate-binding protein
MLYPTANLASVWRRTTLLLLLSGLAACGDDTASDAQRAQTSQEFEARKATMLAHMQNHFDTQVSLPPNVFDAKERGEISQDEIDARIANGEFEKYFQFKTSADIPTDLVWDDGSDLPDIGSPEAVKGGTLYFQLTDFPRTLRMYGPDSNGSFRSWILDDTRMQLGRRHPNDTSIDANGDFRYFPGIAESWAIDRPNGTVYVRLNPAARFSDGVPVTADDMMFSFYFWHQTFIQAPWYNNTFQRNFIGITKYDDHTFSLKLPEAKPNILSRALEFGPLPLHFFYEFGEDYVQRYQWRFVPTTGAYVVTDDSLKKGRSVTLTRNDNWWAKDLKFWRNRYNADRIHLSVIRDTAKAFEAFKKGELSATKIDLPEYFYEKLPVTDDLVSNGYINRAVFYNDTPRPTYGFWINSDRPLLNNQDIRVGINYAINYEKVITEYFRGDYIRMRTTADGFGSFTHPSLAAREFDVARALESFSAAGFSARDPDGVLINTAGERLSFTLSTGYDRFKDTLVILRQEAIKAGLDLRLEVLDSTASFKKASEKQHDIHFVAFNVSPEMYPRYWDFYHSVNAYDVPWLGDGSLNPERKLKPQTNNLQSIANAELDKRIEVYRASDDVDAMQQLAFEMEEILFDDASFVPGFVIPFFRTAYWRWVRWPDDHNVKLARDYQEYHLMWIDQEMEAETRKARKTGATFEIVDKVYDKYRVE